MDPQYNQPAYTGNSLEYLNQIAPQRTSPTGFLNKKVIAIVGAVVVILIIIVVVLMTNSRPAATPSGTILGYRITGLNELITLSENTTVNDSGLRKALAETKVISMSEQYQISTYISLPKTDSKTPVPADEAVTQTVDTLNKSVSRGNFNQSLSEALVAQIKKIEASLLEIRAQTTSQVTLAKIDEDLTQYEAVIERLTDY